jgi:hypothetical protein
MLGSDYNYPLLFDTITSYAPDEWPNDWLQESEVGDLLLVNNEDGSLSCGLLCISDSGAFINLTPQQIRGREPITWPNLSRTRMRIREGKVLLDRN